MKFLKVLLKNFKVLFRLKSTLIAIIFGPLLVIFLIGFAFNSSNVVQLTVGYHAPDNSTLTTDFISSLNDKYTTKSFETNEKCINELKHGLVHTCISFPNDFVIRKGKENNVTFVVDKSRVNLAYTVIEGVSEQIGIKSDELSKGLAQTLTDTLSKTNTIIDSSIGSLIKLKKDMGDNINDANQISSDLNAIKLEVKDFSFSGTSNLASIDGDLSDIKSEVKNTVEDSIDDLNSISGINETEKNSLINKLVDLNETVYDKYNSSTTLLTDLTTKISALQTELDSVEDQIKTAKTNTDTSREKINSLKARLETVNTDINSIKTNLESLSRDISSIEITSSNQIVNPISTKIETITSDNNQLVSLLPYLLMLIIMFVSIMLSSSLVVIEKSSRAFFRVFTTPTRDEFFIITTFVTAFIIVASQIALILSAINYFLIDIFSANIYLNILILSLAISIFIMIGMAIGYFIKSQQGANMTSISIGALFLMLSNFVLPVESMIPQLRAIATYNPFVLASETLRRATIFSMNFGDLFSEIGILATYTVGTFILIIFFQKLTKARYFNNNYNHKAKKIKKQEGLWIKNVLVNNESEFVKEISKLSNDEFKKTINKNSRKISKFINLELKNKSISKNLNKITKKELLMRIAKNNHNILEHIKQKHEKRIREHAKLKK